MREADVDFRQHLNISNIDRTEYYNTFLRILATYSTEEGYIGTDKFTPVQRRRLTHQYVYAMLNCGFPAQSPSIQKAFKWLMGTRTLDEIHYEDSLYYLDLDRVETAIELGLSDSDVCEKAVNYILQHRKGPIAYEIPGEKQEPFFALWCSKILLNYPKRQDCVDAVTETLRYFANEFEYLTRDARDLSFLISLYYSRYPDSRVHEGPIKRMVDRLLATSKEGLFDIYPSFETRLKDLIENGLSKYLVAGVERDIYMSLISTSYVIENLKKLCIRNNHIAIAVNKSVDNLFNILRTAPKNLEPSFPDPYHQLMISARTLSSFSIISGEDIARIVVPKLLDILIDQEKKKKQDESGEEKRRLQAVLKSWIILDWKDDDRETLSGGYSGAKVTRVKPQVKIPNAYNSEGFSSIPLPLMESIIIKSGRKGDLDKERRNYETIPYDFRNMVAAIPSDTYKELIDGELIEYLVIEDLSGYKTLQEILPIMSTENKMQLCSQLIDFLKHFFSMAPTHTHSTGAIRSLYLSPINRSIEIIHDFKQVVSGLDKNDLKLIEQIQTITNMSVNCDNFPVSVMHGDLNLRNILVNGRLGQFNEIKYKLIDLEKFSRKGDYAYDIGELIVDTEIVDRSRDFVSGRFVFSKELSNAFKEYAVSKEDHLYPLRLNLAKIRSLSKLAEIRAKTGQRMISEHPLSMHHAERVLNESILPLLNQAMLLLSDADYSNC